MIKVDLGAETAPAFIDMTSLDVADSESFAPRLLMGPNACESIRLNQNRSEMMLDCFESKINALRLARDVLTSILNIGVFIYN
jgi:hypothetical protein